MSAVWFTADLHLGHRNVIDYCRRPFANVDEMNAELKRRWNAVVRPGDRVYVLGDVALTKPEVALGLARGLAGQKFLVAGNHDDACRSAYEKSDVFVWVKDLATISVEGQKIVVCHYPLLTWPGAYRGSWMLHGHCHGSLRGPHTGKRMDVGTDCHDYTPVSFEEIRRVMVTRGFEAVDHHGTD